jgi:TRAP-type C4-dicarboxylate transport system substrate-binding protein
MASKRTMDKLPPPYQAAIRDAAVAIAPSWRTMMAQKTVEATEFLKTRGCTVTEVDKPAYAEALKPVYEQFRPVVGADLLDSIQKHIDGA